MDIKIWLFVVILLLTLIIGAVIGFFVSRNLFTKYLEKNPPINKNMIRAMMMQMGRKPSERDINRIMESMNQYKNQK
ncbi:MAG TPA: YneF family protein [Acholeplasmataceae bacterium]|nr:YneF family protein [Acholeplasmataceae bacterium]